MLEFMGMEYLSTYKGERTGACRTVSPSKKIRTSAATSEELERESLFQFMLT